MSANCLTIRNLANWQCMTLGPISYPPIGSTQALVILIILIWFGGYWYHMRTYGGHGLDLLRPILEGGPFLEPGLKWFLEVSRGGGGGSGVPGATQLK